MVFITRYILYSNWRKYCKLIVIFPPTQFFYCFSWVLFYNYILVIVCSVFNFAYFSEWIVTKLQGDVYMLCDIFFNILSMSIINAGSQGLRIIQLGGYSFTFITYQSTYILLSSGSSLAECNCCNKFVVVTSCDAHQPAYSQRLAFERLEAVGQVYLRAKNH